MTWLSLNGLPAVHLNFRYTENSASLIDKQKSLQHPKVINRGRLLLRDGHISLVLHTHVVIILGSGAMHHSGYGSFMTVWFMTFPLCTNNGGISCLAPRTMPLHKSSSPPYGFNPVEADAVHYWARSLGFKPNGNTVPSSYPYPYLVHA